MTDQAGPLFMPDINAKSSNEVKKLYEDYPYPSPTAGDMLIPDLSNAVQYIAPAEYYGGRHILDAGCGTGHRLIALAKALPKTRFTGVDISDRSIETAKALARRHGTSNVDFLFHDLSQPLKESYDVVVCSGVVTCIRDPELAIGHLLKSLIAGGFLLLWVYHEYGEFTRLLDRRLAMLFANLSAAESNAAKVETLRKLHLSLPPDQYGTTTVKQRIESSQASIDVDAYLHPVVNVFTFSRMFDLLKRCGADWAAPNGINWPGRSKLIDLGQTMEDSYLAVTARDVLADREYQSAFEAFSVDEKLMVLELAVKPTGFTILCGRNRSYMHLNRRIIQNVREIKDCAGL